MPFVRFSHLKTLLVKVSREEAREKLMLAAYQAFQLGAGGGKNLGEYLSHLGLGDTITENSKPDTPQAAQDGKLSRMGIKAKDTGNKREKK